MVGGPDAVLVVDDTSLPKKGENSVGVAPQYATVLGKTANCQTLVSLTLARGEVPVAVGLALFLPESWTGDPVRMARAGVPEDLRFFRQDAKIGRRHGLPTHRCEESEGRFVSNGRHPTVQATFFGHPDPEPRVTVSPFVPMSPTGNRSGSSRTELQTCLERMHRGWYSAGGDCS